MKSRAVAFQDRGPPGPCPSVAALGGVGERAPPLTLVIRACGALITRYGCAVAFSFAGAKQYVIECREAPLYKYVQIFVSVRSTQKSVLKSEAQGPEGPES